MTNGILGGNPESARALVAAADILAPAPRPPTVALGGVTAIIPRNIAEVLEVARVVILARLAPASYEGKSEDETRSKIVIGILKGSEVGFPPITALSTIAIINNRACIWGDGAVALVQSKGVVEKIEEVWEGGETAGEGGAGKEPIPNDFADDFACVFRIWRRGQANPYVGRYSVRDAKRAHLWGRKQPWMQYPKRMLLARARAYALRDGFADCLMGLAIREEVEDLPPAEAPPVDTGFLDDAPALPPPAEIRVPPLAARPALAGPDPAAPAPPPDEMPPPAPQPDAAAPLAQAPLAIDPEPEPEPTASEIALWTEWGTKMVEKLLAVRELAGLAKLEHHVQRQQRDYAAVLGAEKALALLDLVAERRREIGAPSPLL